MRFTIYLIFPLSFITFSCQFFNENKSVTNTKIDSIESDTIEKLSFWEIPNEDTKTIEINTKNSIDDTELIEKLSAYLTKEKFKIEERSFGEKNAFNNCDENLILNLEGKGILKYYFMRTEAKPKNYYPDFVMYVYEFEDENQTLNAEKQIRKALKSGNRFCNGKSPIYVVRYKNQIIELTTRAEMFRGYILDIKNEIELTE